MPWATALARGGLGRLLTSSSVAALLIGGGAPAAFAYAINDNTGVTIPAVTNSATIDCICPATTA